MKKVSIASLFVSLALVLCLFFMFSISVSAETVAGTITVTQSDGTIGTLTDAAGDNQATVLPVGEGTVTYDADTATVTLDTVTAQLIDFAMNGDFTLNVVGKNVINNGNESADVSAITVTTGNVTVIGDGILDLDAYSFAFHVKAGSFTQKGASLDLNTTKRPFLNASGNVSLIDGSIVGVAGDWSGLEAGGDLSITGGSVTSTATANAFMITGNIKISGGTVSATTTSADSGIRSTGSGKSLEISGGEITANVKTKNGLLANGPIKISGGNISIHTLGSYGINASSSSISVSGGTISVNSEGDHGVHATAGISVSGGTIAVDMHGKNNAFYDNSTVGINVTGGDFNLKANYNGLLSNGTVSVDGCNLTVDAKIAINASTGINISQQSADQPTNLVFNSSPALQLNKANTTLNITGGRITGSGSHFVYVNTNGTVNIGADAIVDFNATTKPVNGTAGYALTINSEIEWEEGKSFADAESARQIKTVNQRPIVDANVSATVTANGNAQAGVTVGLYKDGAEVATAVTGENGTAALVVEDLLAGYTYGGYTLKQIAEDGKGYTYDLTERDVSIFVNANGVVTVTGDTAFANTYVEPRLPYLEGEIVDGKYIVTETGKATEMGLIKIGNDYYYAGPNGVLVTSQKYFAWRLNENCDITTGWYYFDSTGKLVDSGIVDGYYYVD
ncbi:MAG: carbohydrate-binding domain-containing protein, partial [Clostridia bacterium]|nr:carbohydrate-binding domain-containing protein [Clostridia bacterium]